MLCSDARRDMRERFGGRRLANHLRTPDTPLYVRNYVIHLEDEVANLIDAQGTPPMEEPARGWWETPPVEDNDTDVPRREFFHLTNLITEVIDKPLTNWQRKQLDRWEAVIAAHPPTFDPVLKVGIPKDIQERRHQIERIKDVCATGTITATNMYDRGVRIIEQE